MRILTTLFLLCFLIDSQPVYSAGGGGGGASAGGGRASGSSLRSTPQKTPKQKAVSYYKKGIKYRDKAWNYEEKAALETNEKKTAKLFKKAQKEYKKAIKKYRAAIKKVPAFYQAHSSLGYALRKTGDIEGSLLAYNESVKINPVYPEAIEYRAETYLQLNRFEEVKKAYMELFEDYPREYSDQLMKAMAVWNEEYEQSSVEDAESFSKWFKERQEIANNTVSLNQPQVTDWQDNI